MTERIGAVRSASHALELLGRRMAANATYGVYLHARQQLMRVLEELSQPNLPSPRGRQWLDIGLMAARELEADDPELADALMTADHDFKHAT